MGTAGSEAGSPSTGTVERHRSVGRSVARIDSHEKVTGAARYVSDLDRDDLLHAAVVRSRRPHARIESVDTSAAEDVPGVAAVVTRGDVMGRFDDRVRHYGDLIAAVAAEDAETAQRAARAVEYDLEPLEPVFEAADAVREGGPVLHENNPDFAQHGRHDFDVANDAFTQNIDDYHAVSVGDVDEGFAAADTVLEGTYASPRVNHCNLDTHSCIAEWEPDGTLVLTETIGSPGRSQEELAGFLGIDHNRVRIQSPPTASSSFGGRSLAKPSLEPVAATLSRETDRPVKLWFDREEEFVATETRHRTYFSLKAGVTDDGDLTALKLDVMADTGPYPNGVGHIVLTNSRDRPLELYRLEHYEYEGVSVFTNNVPAGEYRGIGSTQLTWALESHMDELCREAGLDPVAFRERNLVDTGYERPHTGQVIGSCGVRDCLERGLDRFDAIRAGPSDDPDRVRGWGFAAGTHTTASGAFSEDSSEARLTLRADGTLHASTAAIEHGQGAQTVMAQVVTEETGIPTDRIEVERFSTTDDLDDVLGSVASRSTYIIGATVGDAARRLAGDLRERAAAEFGVDPAAVTLEDGHAIAPSGDARPVESFVDGDGLVAEGRAESNLTPPSYGVHVAEVEVDTVTGAVDVLTYVAAQDVGFAVNPRMVEGQLEGAVLHGIEFALHSEVRLDDGLPVNANLADYPAITPIEMPDALGVEIIESNEETGPYGAKGIGTPAMPPIAPALCNAVRDATGERFHSAPVSAEAVQEAVRR